jgi:hypothetical protein
MTAAAVDPGTQLVHNLGNSISAAALHVKALENGSLTAEQRGHVLAALGELAVTGEQLIQLRRIGAKPRPRLRPRRPRRRKAKS